MSRLARTVLTALGASAVLIAVAAPAWAHVTVTAPGATSGGSDQEITFRVPVEEDKNTVGLTVQLPTTTPIASVLVRPVPGWTHTQTTSKLAKPITTDDGTITDAVSQVTWKAGAGAGLDPGEYGDFTIIAGQLPSATQLTFKAIQTYSDGSQVRWIEVAAPGSSDEPEHPAPVLTLAPAAAGGASPSASASTITSGPLSGSVESDGVLYGNGKATASKDSSSNTGPVVLSIIALVIAVAAFAFGFVSRAKSRHTGDPA